LNHNEEGQLLDQLTFHRRDKGLAEAVREEQPEVVVVGNTHGYRLKMAFPESHLTIFEVPDLYQNRGERFLAALYQRISGIKKPDEIYDLDYKMRPGD
jgi:hypothetical protein